MGREGRVRENKESFDISPHSPPPPLDLSSRESEGPSLTLPFHFERRGRGRLLGGRRLRRRRGGGKRGGRRKTGREIRQRQSLISLYLKNGSPRFAIRVGYVPNSIALMVTLAPEKKRVGLSKKGRERTFGRSCCRLFSFPCKGGERICLFLWLWRLPGRAGRT